MKYTTAALLATFALANAQSTQIETATAPGVTDTVTAPASEPSSVGPSQYSSPAEEACNPSNSSGMPNFDAPCNAVVAIEYQCIYGPDYLAAAANAGPYNRLRRRQSDDSDDDDASLPMQSNSTQRTCICESQFFDQVQGCANCYTAHGSTEDMDSGLADKSAIASLSSAYCAVSATPSLGLADYLFNWAENYNSSNPATSTPTGTMSDSIGNKTDVSLYFTPSVTGTAAWIVAEATSGASSGMGSITSENTVSGMIRPTASANNAAAQSSGSASGASGTGASSTSSAGAAVMTAAGMGMLGLAGLVAVL